MALLCLNEHPPKVYCSQLVFACVHVCVCVSVCNFDFSKNTKD